MWLSRSELGAKGKGKDELNVAVVIFDLLLSFWYFLCFNSLCLSLCCLAVPSFAMWEVVHPWTIDDDEAANETWQQHQQCCLMFWWATQTSKLGRSVCAHNCSYMPYA